jgi:hypothetical protein
MGGKESEETMQRDKQGRLVMKGPQGALGNRDHEVSQGRRVIRESEARRESRGPQENKDLKASRVIRETKAKRESRGPQENKDLKASRVIRASEARRESRGPQENKDLKASKASRGPQGKKDLKASQGRRVNKVRQEIPVLPAQRHRIFQCFKILRKSLRLRPSTPTLLQAVRRSSTFQLLAAEVEAATAEEAEEEEEVPVVGLQINRLTA